MRQFLFGPIQLFPTPAFVKMVVVMLLHLNWQFVRMLLLVVCSPLFGFKIVDRTLKTKPLSFLAEPGTSTAFKRGRKLASQYAEKYSRESIELDEVLFRLSSGL